MAVSLCQHIQARRSRGMEEVWKTGRRVNMYGNCKPNNDNNRQSWHFTLCFAILCISLCLLESVSSWFANPQSKTLRCPVFHIKAPIPANSHIVIPKNINNSLGLTGRYFYLLFRPHPGKYFVVHLDVCSKVLGRILLASELLTFVWHPVLRCIFTWTYFPSPPSTRSLVHHIKEGRVVRISFSNMFKEFKSSPTWLQYPFQCGAEGDSASVSSSKGGRRGKN